MWRLLIAEIPPPEAPLQQSRRRDRDSDDSDDEDSQRVRDPAFRALCYYLDYDGKTYGAVERTFRIDYYEGEKDIRELDVYPLRFAHSPDALLQEAKEAGKLFTEAIPRKHMMCGSWTCGTDPSGFPVRLKREDVYAPRSHIPAPIYVEGEVIIDLKGKHFLSMKFEKANRSFGQRLIIRSQVSKMRWRIMN